MVGCNYGRHLCCGRYLCFAFPAVCMYLFAFALGWGIIGCIVWDLHSDLFRSIYLNLLPALPVLELSFIRELLIWLHEDAFKNYV